MTKKVVFSIPSRCQKDVTWPRFTEKQEQYLGFSDGYTSLSQRPRAEADIQKHLGVTPPTVHGMLLTLESLGWITRKPGQPRTVRVTLDREDLPPLKQRAHRFQPREHQPIETSMPGY